MNSDAARYLEFQGSRIAHVPEQPGLYAWYYRPTAVQRETTPATLARFLGGQARISTEIQQRYGVRVVGEVVGETLLGADRQAVGDAIVQAFEEAEPFLNWFFRSAQFAHFCRPVYIGIAKNLYERVYNQHYLSLAEYWEDTSRVSRFLAASELATVQEAMDRLDLPHSFALEARVRGVSPKDLMVSVLVTEDMPSAIGPDSGTSDTSTRRALERLLQLLSDPICGRR
ncbi:hypothetical protein GCM10009416_13280 [Craurococcus roseus]|uniref:Uncharacterized protein n=1 Tax=Craurococcus roseus TaxID=77585 RepID=A0ABN1EX19_9PROT